MNLRDFIVVRVTSALHSLTYYYPSRTRPFLGDPRSLFNVDLECVRVAIPERLPSGNVRREERPSRR